MQEQATPFRPGIRVSRITSDAEPLAKAFRLDGENRLIKTVAAYLVSGHVETLALETIDDFAALLPSLARSQALTYGVSRYGDGPVLSEKRWEKAGSPAGVILRNREHFDWPAGGGVWLLDYDASKEGPALTRDALLQKLYGAIPELEAAPQIWWPSAGSCIVNRDTGDELVGVRGQRLYVWVRDARDIERLGAVLSARLWLRGEGRFEVSKSGQMLARTPVDTGVWQPERLDFAAGSTCEAPLEQRRGAPLRLGGALPLDGAMVPDISETDAEKLERAKSAARLVIKPEVQKVRNAWVELHAEDLQRVGGLNEAAAKEVAREAIEYSRLMGDFTLTTQDGQRVTVATILAERSVWAECRFHDPIDADCTDERIAMVNLFSGGRPYLYSHAHGGHRYELCREVHTIQLSEGGTREAVQQTLEFLRQDGSLYEHGRSVVAVSERGEVRQLGIYSLKNEIERVVSFRKWDARSKDKWKRADCSDEISRRIREMKGDTGLPALAGIVQFPTMTADGRLLDKPGYDADTGLLLLNPTNRKWPSIHRAPTEQEVLDALNRLWRPLASFPFVDDVSRGIALAGMLTAVVRRALPTAPAFLVSAPAAGSGKTLLASSIVELAGRAAPMTLPDTDTEIDKLIISVLRKGPAAVFLDNVTGAIDSKVLNAMLTAPTYDGRILGVSETTGALPSNVLVMLTGNNARPRGDMCRRMLVCEIDPRVEQPYLRQFDFNPVDYMRRERMVLAQAALTILAGRVATGTKRFAAGDMGSFEVWDHLVRQAVLWVGELERRALGAAAVGYGDPMANLHRLIATDDDAEALGDLLETWHATQDGCGYKAGELFGAHDRARRNDYGAEAGLDAVGRMLLSAAPWLKNPKSLSSWFKNIRHRIVRGLRLECRPDNSANCMIWYVQRV